MTITSTQARELVGEAMDARSLNHWQYDALIGQSHALINDTDEIDCVFDHLSVLVASGVKPSQVAELLKLTVALAEGTRALTESNRVEGEYEMSIAGQLDQLATRLYDAAESRGHGNLTIKEIGEQLRWALPIVFEPAGHTLADRLQADQIACRIVDTVDSKRLFSGSVSKEIRPTNYARLVELHAARHNTEAQEAA